MNDSAVQQLAELTREIDILHDQVHTIGAYVVLILLLIAGISLWRVFKRD